MNIRPAPRRAGHLMDPEVLEAFEFAAQADAPNTQRAYYFSAGLERRLRESGLFHRDFDP